jgi:hypothetical protein
VGGASDDYPIYSATARGTKQWRVDVGVNAVSRRYSLTANWLTTAWGENTHRIHNSVGLGVSRTFD